MVQLPNSAHFFSFLEHGDPFMYRSNSPPSSYVTATIHSGSNFLFSSDDPGLPQPPELAWTSQTSPVLPQPGGFEATSATFFYPAWCTPSLLLWLKGTLDSPLHAPPESQPSRGVFFAASRLPLFVWLFHPFLKISVFMSVGISRHSRIVFFKSL